MQAAALDWSACFAAVPDLGELIDLQWCYFIRKRRPVSYGYSFEDLLALLHGHAPAKVDAVARHRRRVEHGHLSVGLKIHCLGDGSQFSTLVAGLGGSEKILDVNRYKHSRASLCLVLPPRGQCSLCDTPS